MQSINSEENTDDTDGIPDTILKIALKLTELLKNNIDSLKIPEILKLALKRLRNLFLNKKDGENDAESKSRLQPEETNSSTSDSQTTEEISESTGTGVKNIESRVRSRRFKIKGMIAQPKIVEVKKTVE